MPSDVNRPEDSSSEEQRNGSDSQTDDQFKNEDGALQVLAEKPGISDIVDRLMNPDTGDGEGDEGDLENPNEEDEEGKETEDADADGEGEGEGEDADGEPKAKKAKADDKTVEGEPIVEDDADEEADEKPEAKAKSDEDPDEDERQSYSRDANKRIRQLIEKRKAAEAAAAEKDAEIEQLRVKASYRDDLEKSLADHKVDTKAWDEWTQLGLLMQRDPARAAVYLGKMAQTLGYQDPDGPITKVDKDLEDLVAAQEMTKEAAEKIQRTRIASRMQAPPVPRQPTEAAPTATSDPRSPSLPRLTRDEADVGRAAIKAVDAEFRKKYPDQWDKIVGEVQAEMALYKGSHPSSWGKIARESAEKIVAKRVAKAPKSSDRPDPSLRATGGSSRAVTRNNTGPAKSKSELAERMAKGTLFRR